MRRLAIAGLLVLMGLVLVGGCIGAHEGDEANVSSAATGGAQPSDPQAAGARLGAASPLPTQPPAEDERSLEGPPTYRTGEWWEIEIEFQLSGTSATLTRIVAGTQGDAYLIGMPPEDFSDEAIVEHLPPFGRVDQRTLDFHAHDRPLNFVDFPLEEGRTWETQWWSGTPLDAEVASVDNDTATVRLDRGSRTVEGVWDAQLGTFETFESPGHLRYEVLAHGYGYEGEVRVPAGRDLVFCHGRTTVAIPIEACTQATMSPAGPIERVGVPDTYDRVSYGLLIFDSPGAEQAGTGAYRLAVTDPAGDVESATKLPDQPGLVHQIGGEGEPEGIWKIEAEAGGGGAAIFEGVGYVTYEVGLASS